MPFNVLGINFGHDSAVTLVRDGKVISCQLSERITRKKNYSGITNSLVSSFFNLNDIDPNSIDFVAVTSTQSGPIMVENGNVLGIEAKRHPDDGRPSPCEHTIKESGLSIFDFLADNIADPVIGPTKVRLKKTALSIDSVKDNPSATWSLFPMLDYYETVQGIKEVGLTELPSALTRNPESVADNRFGFHLPVTVSLFGRRVPASIVHHHAAHMATAYYLSDFDHGVIVTLDGCVSAQQGGWIGIGDGAKIIPINPHFLEVGKLYDRISSGVLKLGSSSSGKMMGLAPYGKPLHFDPDFVGNSVDFQNLREQEHSVFFGANEHMSFTYIRYLYEKFKKEQPDRRGLGDPDKATLAVNANIAASTHQIFTHTIRDLFVGLRDWVEEVSPAAPNVTAAGGSFLSCPTNSEVQNSLGFKNYFVPPYCDDSGIAIGAALWATHNLSDVPVPTDVGISKDNPYIGNTSFDVSLDDVLDREGNGLKIVRADAALGAARDIAENRIVGWFQGRSEVGPRALGHRSILADARDFMNWRRVNKIKKRAEWRPFAPAILEEYLPEYFEGGPNKSSNMLFNYDVVKDTIPAITHVDGSARAQTVGPETGLFRDLLTHFHSITGVPLVLNTSLNGPGEPIVESPKEALDLFRSTDLDVLYMGSWRVSDPD